MVKIVENDKLNNHLYNKYLNLEKMKVEKNYIETDKLFSSKFLQEITT